ncbi:hypothetical protein [Pseudoxanthomonas japonensis]|uniref:hypothetical protein n=1 Tax=Pseudoxanthomonas japonensis TaxID=69284 RepID=UPI001BCF2AFD|nr:hypothetical protein [Pseudoxanthomonas japonensis]
MLLSDFLKSHGIQLDLQPDPHPALSDGVRFLLFLLSRRHAQGKSIAIDKTILKNEWPDSISESFDQSLDSAVTAGYVQGGPSQYSLTDLGKSAAH